MNERAQLTYRRRANQTSSIFTDSVMPASGPLHDARTRFASDDVTNDDVTKL